jgi:1,4-dihydroxy-2-naphthoate octaprenyltransferase
MKLGILVTFILAGIVGFYLMAVGGWPILVVGVASILSALSYSGGPYPIASHGLGDLFVFIFFGLVAVCGTYYVQALHLTNTVLLTSLPIGFLITAILVVNNLRDIRTDSSVGKRTMAVILGVRRTRWEYLLLLGLSYLVPPLLWISGRCSAWVLLTMLSLPPALKMIILIWREEGRGLNRALAGTANLTLLFSLFFSMGLILSG